MAHGQFVWNELATGDVEAAKTFFAEVAGWSYDAMPMPGGGDTYWVAKSGGRSVAGLMDKRAIPHEVPPHWLAYLDVDDIDARLAAAQAKGAKVIRGPWNIPGVGRIAVVTDPTGAVMGWMTPEPPAAA